jgi:hypothetical protein
MSNEKMSNEKMSNEKMSNEKMSNEKMSNEKSETLLDTTTISAGLRSKQSEGVGFGSVGATPRAESQLNPPGRDTESKKGDESYLVQLVQDLEIDAANPLDEEVVILNEKGMDETIGEDEVQIESDMIGSPDLLHVAGQSGGRSGASKVPSHSNVWRSGGDLLRHRGETNDANGQTTFTTEVHF